MSTWLQDWYAYFLGLAGYAVLIVMVSIIVLVTIEVFAMILGYRRDR